MTPDAARQGWLCIERIAVRGQRLANGTKGSVDSDFVVNVNYGDGGIAASYPAGLVPSKIALEQGDYMLETHSDNIDSWKNENSGRGAAAYRAVQSFTIEPDMYRYVRVVAPLVNFGIRFTTEDGLDKWFTSFSLEINENANRNVTVAREQTAWCDATSVCIIFLATNTDGDSFQSEVLTLDTQAGHLYTLHYSLSPSEEGSAGISVSVDDEFEDAGEELVIL